MANPQLAKYGQAAVARGYNTYGEAKTYNKARDRRDFWMKVVLPIAVAATGGAALSVAGGAGAAGAAGGAGAASGAGAGAAGAAGGAGTLAATSTAAGLAPYAGTAAMAPSGAALVGGSIGTGGAGALAATPLTSLSPYAGTVTAAPSGAAAYGGSVGTGLRAAPVARDVVNNAGGKTSGNSWLRLAEIGAPIATTLWGGRKANQANERAMQFELEAAQRAERIAADLEARRRIEWDAVQRQERDRWDAEQEQARLDREFLRQQWDAGANRRALRDAALVSLGGIGRSSAMPITYGASGSTAAAPTRQTASGASRAPVEFDMDGTRSILEMTGGANGGYASPARIARPGQYDYRPRLIPLSRIA